MSAVVRWKEMILAEHAQTDRIRAAERPADHWTEYAGQFRDDPHRSGDALLDALRARLQPTDTLTDVGAGGGRLALPLALHCRRVTAVEPSPSMAAVLLQAAADYGIANIDLVESDWLAAPTAPTELTLCSHVVYTIQDIAPFVSKLTQSARRLCLAVLFQRPPQTQLYPLWPQVHGEPRHPLPSLPEFLAVLSELGLNPEVTELPHQPARGFDSPESARELLSRRLYLRPHTPPMQRFESLRPHLLEQHENGHWQLTNAPQLTPCLVAWPGQAN